MNTINLSAEIFRELGNIADNESYLEKVLRFIKSLKKERTTASVRGAAYTSLLEQLSDFQEYEAGWDGFSALPLNKTVVKNFKNVLAKASDDVLAGWYLSPETNGTLLISRADENAGINLGTHEFSYFIIADSGEVNGENHVKYSTRNILATLNNLKQLNVENN